MYRSAYIITVLFMFYSLQGKAGAWTKEKGKGYEQISFTYLKYNSILNGFDDSKKLKREVTDFTLQNYLEYGISNRLTLVTVVPYKFLETGTKVLEIDSVDDIFPGDTATAGKLEGLSNITVGLKYALKQGNYVLAVQMRVGTNNNDYDKASGLRTGYDSWLFTPSVLYGKGWNNSYFTSELGFQYKTNDYSDNLIASAEIGTKVSWKNTKTWFSFVLDALVPVNEEKFADHKTVHSGMFQNGEGWVSPGIKINHFITDKLIVNFATYGAIWADHGGAAPTLNFGLAYEW